MLYKRICLCLFMYFANMSMANPNDALIWRSSRGSARKILNVTGTGYSSDNETSDQLVPSPTYIPSVYEQLMDCRAEVAELKAELQQLREQQYTR